MPSIIIMGPAGSGKTTITRSLRDYLMKRKMSLDVISCNLDPGSKDSRDWDLDIRTEMTVDGIMKMYGLGPNGAVSKAFELLEGKIDLVFKDLRIDSSSYLLIDTPGQIEPMLFTSVGEKLLLSLSNKFDDLIGIFLIPADIANDPFHFTFLQLFFIGLRLKVPIPMIHVISKADLLNAGKKFFQKPDLLHSAIINANKGEITELAIRALTILEDLMPLIKIIKFSM
ncbi:MAG: ATP/GTP-binding protein, partial [Promethearchaeota archaeon]